MGTSVVQPIFPNRCESDRTAIWCFYSDHSVGTILARGLQLTFEGRRVYCFD